jgi:5-methylcytosine-specific restriction endonuclease McrA
MITNFLDNKYSRWYYAIIVNAQARISDGYTENHHIIPKCLGGSNLKENLVNLTACEHCGKTTTKGNYKRWHSNNCKTIQGELKFLA